MVNICGISDIPYLPSNVGDAAGPGWAGLGCERATAVALQRERQGVQGHCEIEALGFKQINTIAGQGKSNCRE